MTRSHHRWEPGSEPPKIPPHSRAKLRVFDAYLRKYVSVLTGNVRKDQLKLTLIDGFAGGGIHRDGDEKVLGSPLIMLQAMKDAEAAAQARRRKEFKLDCKYIFIEKDKGACDYLRSTINSSEFRTKLDDEVNLTNGTFVEHVPAIIELVKQRRGSERAIFILDQFGYKDVPRETIRTILREVENAEIILTFAIDHLTAYISTDEASQSTLRDWNIDLSVSEIESLKQQRELRRTIQFLLHQQIPLETGARYYTPFFIRSADSGRGFWLLHLSGHHRARDVMMGVHWQEGTSFAHYGRPGLRMLAYDPERDDSWTKQKYFSGYHFDDTARAQSEEELFEQLPEVISACQGGIPFEELFATTTNQTPVTSDIMKEVISDLAKEGIIKLRDRSGSLKRGVKVEKGDILLYSRQTRIDFGRP